MIIKIKSKNEYLLDILHKNPNTDKGLYLKQLKNGILIGNVISNHEYHCVFMDLKNSYLPEEGNQIDFQSYCSPLLALNIGTEFFNHLYKEKQTLLKSEISWLYKTYQEIDNHACEIEVPTFFIDSNYVKNNVFLLSKYIEGVTVKLKIGNNYELKVIGNSVTEAIQKFTIVSLFIHFTNRYAIYTYIDDSFILKYVTTFCNIPGIPYFVFYLFIKRIFRNPKQFENFKPQLESYFDNKIQFVFTDTHQSRKEFISEKLDFNQSVLDFGCGELQYFKTLHKKGFTNKYFAYDEVDFKETADKLIDTFNVDNLYYLNNLDDIIGFEGQIILSEVIEHNTLEEAKKLMIWIRDNTHFTKLIITTPDKDFNVNYKMEDEFRHDDHDFELTNQEFKEIINEIFPFQNQFYGIGDCVNGIYPSSSVIIEKNIL